MSSFLMSAFGSEEFQDQVAQVPLVTDLEDNSPSLQVANSLQQYDSAHGEIDRVGDMATAMEALQEVIGSFGNEHLDERHLALIQCAGQFAAAGSPISPRAVIPAYESYTGTIGAESIGDKISAAYNHIAGFVGKIGEFAGKVFQSAAAALRSNQAKVRKVREAAEKSQQESFSVTGNFAIAGNATGANVATALRKQYAIATSLMDEALKLTHANFTFIDSLEKTKVLKNADEVAMNQAKAFKAAVDAVNAHEGPLVTGHSLKVVETAGFPSSAGEVIAYYKGIGFKKDKEKASEQSVTFDISKAELVQVLRDYESNVQKSSSDAIKVLQENAKYQKYMTNFSAEFRKATAAGALMGASAVGVIGAIIGATKADAIKDDGNDHLTGVMDNMKNLKEGSWEQKKAVGKMAYGLGKNTLANMEEDKKRMVVGAATGVAGAAAGAFIGSIVIGATAATGLGIRHVLLSLFSKTYKVMSKSEKLTTEMVNHAHQCLDITPILKIAHQAIKSSGAAIPQSSQVT